MLDTILRPVALPSHFAGRPAPCDFFDERGMLMLRAGVTISPHATHGGSASSARRLYCQAVQAERIAPADPIGRLRAVGEALSMLDVLIESHSTVGHVEFFELAEALYHSWLTDADACIGYARLARFDRPSVCQVVLAALFAAELAAAQGLPARDVVIAMGAALTMNLGSMRLHDAMHDCVGKPDDKAREALKLHPARAARLLERIGGFPEEWVEAVAQHHEHVDGSGYPLGLQRTEINLCARILRVVDIFAARLRGRRGRAPQYWNLSQARDTGRLMRHVFAGDRELLDQSLVRLLMTRMGCFPPGSVVRLNNGELALIARRTTPPGGVPTEVLAFTDASGKRLVAPRSRKIGPRDCRIQGYAHDEPHRLPQYDWLPLWGYRH